MEKTYLGDSVYVEVEDGMIKLTTDNGEGPSNTIFIEEQVWYNLVKFVSSGAVCVSKGDGR